MIIKENRKLNEFNDNTNGAELFIVCMNIITDNYGNKFNTSLQNVTENVMSEFEEYINDEASNFVVDEIYAGGELDKEKYLDEFDNFITFNLRENDINEYDFNESMDVNEARQMHTWSITYNGRGNKAKTHMVDAPDAYEANRKARRELGISYNDIEDVTMLENKDNLKEDYLTSQQADIVYKELKRVFDDFSDNMVETVEADYDSYNEMSDEYISFEEWFRETKENYPNYFKYIFAIMFEDYLDGGY